MRIALTTVAVALVILLGSSPATADVTLKSRASGKAMGFDSDGVTTTYIKGHRMRSDVEAQGKTMSTILDLDKNQMIVLNDKKKQAEVYDLGQTVAAMHELDAGTRVEMTPTGETRTVAGISCKEQQMKVNVTTHPVEGENLDVVLSGPVCLASGAPGAGDYRAFYTAMAEKGLFFGDPRSAKAQPGQARGMTELYRKMAEAGIALATDLGISFEGSGMMATMMERMGKVGFGTEVLEISTDSIPASTFEIPAGYKTKQK